MTGKEDYFSNAPDALLLVSRCGRVARANDEAGLLFGLPLDVLCSKKVEDLMPEHLRAAHEAHRERFMASPSRRPMGARARLEVTRANGAKRTVEISLAPMPDEHVLVALRDVQDRIDLENERRTLEARAQAAERMATLGTLTAGVAHEINNPLMVVSAMLESARELLHVSLTKQQPGPVEGALGRLDAANDAVWRIAQIVRDLRAFSHVQGQLEVVDLAVATRSALSMFRCAREMVPNVELEIERQVSVIGDSGRLVQVVLNLLSNASHALRDPSVPGGIRVRVGDAGAGRAFVEVADRGSGIADETLTRIFDPFFTTKGVGKGTGLGLTISLGLVRSMGGELVCDTKLGEGSTFRIELPSAPTPSLERESHAPATETPLRVLVVDDDEHVRNAIGRIVGREYDLALVGSVDEALAEVASGRRVDLVLCDLMMPKRDGVALHAELSILAPALAERMVFMTGAPLSEATSRFFWHPDRERVEKPFTKRSLLEALGRAAKRLR